MLYIFDNVAPGVIHFREDDPSISINVDAYTNIIGISS